MGTSSGTIAKQLYNQYRGQYKEGLRHGKGIFHYADGSKYDGEWKEDKKDGHGVFTFEDGSFYEGLFVRDRMAQVLFFFQRVFRFLVDV